MNLQLSIAPMNGIFSLLSPLKQVCDRFIMSAFPEMEFTCHFQFFLHLTFKTLLHWLILCPELWQVFTFMGSIQCPQQVMFLSIKLITLSLHLLWEKRMWFLEDKRKHILHTTHGFSSHLIFQLFLAKHRLFLCLELNPKCHILSKCIAFFFCKSNLFSLVLLPLHSRLLIPTLILLVPLRNEGKTHSSLGMSTIFCVLY